MLGKHSTDFTSRPRLLLAYADAAYASQCGRYFRRHGWQVEMVASGSEARALAGEYRPNVVVLDAALLEREGWQISAEISIECPDLRIILVADEPAERSRAHLDSVGADLVVSHKDGAAGLAAVILDGELIGTARRER